MGRDGHTGDRDANAPSNGLVSAVPWV